jgi:DisA bacterial checkpoint controller nucleotide-binding
MLQVVNQANLTYLETNWEKLVSDDETALIAIKQFRMLESELINITRAMRDEIASIVNRAGLSAVVSSRPKTVESIARKWTIKKSLDFSELGMIEIKPSKSIPDYKYYPDFVSSLVSSLTKDEFGLILTKNRECVIINHDGLVASLRGESWYIYDAPTFKNSLADALGDYRLGCNLFDVTFDLSYRRHGALLIYDPNKAVLEHVANKGSLVHLSHAGKSLPHDMLVDSVKKIIPGQINYQERRKSVFLEIASLDGAVIFDKEKVLGFGSMIESHANVGDHLGARTTAAISAFHWGGKPIKISSDGDISVYFSDDDTSNPRNISFR